MYKSRSKFAIFERSSLQQKTEKPSA